MMIRTAKTTLRLTTPAVAAALLAGCATVPAPPMADAPSDAPVEVAIIGINDFHGNLEPPRRAITAADTAGGTVQVPAGGAAWLASAIDGLRAKHPNNVPPILGVVRREATTEFDLIILSLLRLVLLSRAVNFSSNR